MGQLHVGKKWKIVIEAWDEDDRVTQSLGPSQRGEGERRGGFVLATRGVSAGRYRWP